MDSGSAVDFFALFPDDDAAQSFNNAINGMGCCACPSHMRLTGFADPQQLRAVFSSAPTLSNPRLVSPGSGDASSTQQQGALLCSASLHAHRANSSSFSAPAPRASTGTVTATGGGGGVGTGGSGGSASGNTATPGSPGYGAPGAPGTVTTSDGR